MSHDLWAVLIGGLLISIALAASLLKRLPLSYSTLYLLAGLALGPAGYGLLQIDPVRQSAMVRLVAELAVVVSLFTAGLKLRRSLTDPQWWISLRLGLGAVVLTVALVALVGVLALGLPLGAAILLGAILAPTDPVLAADVRVEHPRDSDRLRFSLTSEAGLNEGAALPFMLLGLGLLGLHDLGEHGWRWLVVDAAWALGAGLGIGWLLGHGIATLVLYLRREHQEAVGLDDFLALGLMALSYGAATMLQAAGVLAVFAAGLAVRRTERQESPVEQPVTDVPAASQPAAERAATEPETAPAYMAETVLNFNEQLERIGEVAVVLLIGAMLTPALLTGAELWFVPVVLLVVRPLAVGLSLLGSRTSRTQRGLIAWFGIRGIGSIFYLAFAVHHGLTGDLATRLTSLTLATVAASILLHGISVTPLMEWYERRAGRRVGAATRTR